MKCGANLHNSPQIYFIFTDFNKLSEMGWCKDPQYKDGIMHNVIKHAVLLTITAIIFYFQNKGVLQ